MMILRWSLLPKWTLANLPSLLGKRFDNVREFTLSLTNWMLCRYQRYAWGEGPRDEVGTLNVLGHPRWGILANFEHKCWPRDREVWTMLKRWKRTGFWMWGAWIWVFCHLESAQNSQKFEVSSCNKMEEQKWFNKLLFFYFAFVPKFSCNCIFTLFFFVMLG